MAFIQHIKIAFKPDEPVNQSSIEKTDVKTQKKVSKESPRRRI